MYELYIIHPWYGRESLYYDDLKDVMGELKRRGFHFRWDYNQGHVVLCTYDGHRAQVFKGIALRDITQQLPTFC